MVDCLDYAFWLHYTHREPIKTIYNLALLPRLPDWQFAQVKRICEPVLRHTGKHSFLHRYELKFFGEMCLFFYGLSTASTIVIESRARQTCSKIHCPCPRNRAIKGVAESKHTLVGIAGIAIWPDPQKYENPNPDKKSIGIAKNSIPKCVILSEKTRI